MHVCTSTLQKVKTRVKGNAVVELRVMSSLHPPVSIRYSYRCQRSLQGVRVFLGCQYRCGLILTKGKNNTEVWLAGVDVFRKHAALSASEMCMLVPHGNIECVELWRVEINPLFWDLSGFIVV